MGLGDFVVPVRGQASPWVWALPHDSLAREKLGGEGRGEEARTRVPQLILAFLQAASATCAQTRPTRSTSCRQEASRLSPTACLVLTRRRCYLLSPHSCS